MVRLSGGIIYDFGSFQGQVNNQTGVLPYIDLSAAVVDSVTGRAVIDIVGAADYLFVSPTAGVVFCLKPQLPAFAAAVIDCDGGADFTKAYVTDHNLGQVEPGGFSSAACLSAGGRVEGTHRLCAAGRVDQTCHDHLDCDTSVDALDGVCGLDGAACTGPAVNAGNECRADGDCDSNAATTDGVCGFPGTHFRTCNGPLTQPGSAVDSGPGALWFPEPGLPASLAVEQALPCGDEGDGLTTFLPFTSAQASATILDADNVATATLTDSAQGASFSCADWTNSNGPGCLSLIIPALDQFLGLDTLTELRLCGP